MALTSTVDVDEERILFNTSNPNNLFLSNGFLGCHTMAIFIFTPEVRSPRKSGLKTIGLTMIRFDIFFKYHNSSLPSHIDYLLFTPMP